MGAANVRFAFARWGHLPDRPFRLLVHMALVSLDTDAGGQPARRYFARRAAMVEALGRAPSDERAVHAAEESVRAALATLVNAGAATRLVRGGNGRTAVYRLNLDLLPSPQGQGEPAPTFQGEPAPQGQGEPARSGRVSLAPRNHDDPSEEPSRGQAHLGPVPHQGPSEPVDDERERAGAVLTAAGAERGQAALALAHERHPDASTRDLVILAAELVGAGR